MKNVNRNLSLFIFSLILIFAPVYSVRAIYPAIGSVVTSVVGATVVDAGVNALVNVVAGKSPWAANDPVYGSKVKIPVNGISSWVKKNYKSVLFWSAALAVADYFIDESGNLSSVSIGSCSPYPQKTLNECVQAHKEDMIRHYKGNSNYVKTVVKKVDSLRFGIIHTFCSIQPPVSCINTSAHYFKTNSPSSSVSPEDFNKFVADSLTKVGHSDNPFTPSGQNYPVYPVDGQFWPSTLEPFTPPMIPTEPWPVPVPSPQPTPTPDNPAYPSQPDLDWKPFPLPNHIVDPVTPPNPDPDTGTQIKPLPDGGFIIPNPLPVTVVDPVDVNVLNQLDQGLTVKQLQDYHDAAAGSLSDAPPAGVGDGISELVNAYDDLIKNKMDFSIPSLPSPYSHFNFDMGSCRLPSFSASILGDVKRIQVNSEFCTFYDGVGRPVVAWLFFMLTVLYIYLLTMRTVRAQ